METKEKVLKAERQNGNQEFEWYHVLQQLYKPESNAFKSLNKNNFHLRIQCSVMQSIKPEGRRMILSNYYSTCSSKREVSQEKNSKQEIQPNRQAKASLGWWKTAFSAPALMQPFCWGLPRLEQIRRLCYTNNWIPNNNNHHFYILRSHYVSDIILSIYALTIKS